VIGIAGKGGGVMRGDEARACSVCAGFGGGLS
jgi:hypothetical protein